MLFDLIVKHQSTCSQRKNERNKGDANCGVSLGLAAGMGFCQLKGWSFGAIRWVSRTIFSATLAYFYDWFHLAVLGLWFFFAKPNLPELLSSLKVCLLVVVIRTIFMWFSTIATSDIRGRYDDDECFGWTSAWKSVIDHYGLLAWNSAGLTPYRALALVNDLAALLVVWVRSRMMTVFFAILMWYWGGNLLCLAISIKWTSLVIMLVWIASAWLTFVIGFAISFLFVFSLWIESWSPLFSGA